MIWQDTSEKYIGQWLESFQNGLGLHIWYESKGEQKYLRNRYVGEWKNGFRHGFGVFFYANGGKYEGMWEQNYKNGYGVFTFHDGGHFAGKFTMDRMDYNNAGYIAGANLTKTTSNANTTNTKLGVSGSKIVIKNQKDGLKTILALNEEEEEKTKRTAIKVVENKKEKEKNEDKEKKEKIKKKDNDGTKIVRSPNKTGENPSATKTKDPKKEIDIPKLVKGAVKTTGDAITAIKTITDPKKDSEIPKVIRNPVKTVDNLTAVKTISDPKKDSESPKKIKSSKNITDVIPAQEKLVLEIQDNEEDSKKQSKPIFSTKAIKESEQNPFKTLLDITDILETEPELESSLRDVENILLRHLSEMKVWYRYYTNKESINTDMNDSHIKETINNRLLLLASDKEIEPAIDNNDIGFAMELKDVWKFMRESNILSIDFTLASFNRLYFRGPKNYIEMYLCPDEIKLYSKEYFEYIYAMITKSKDDFMFKNREKFSNSNNPSNQQDFPNLLFKPSELETNFDIHSKKHVVLLRHFYESIVRIAYLKYFQSNEQLHKKIKMLIENCIKLNSNFKKLAKKSNTHDSSLNSTLILDMKVKVFENSFDPFLKEHDTKLKKSFQNLFAKTTNSFKKSDMTITYRFFYENIIKRSGMLKDIIDKFKYAEIMSIYHKEKIIIKEENINSREVAIYIETLLDCEIIFFEFCELVFFCGRKYFTEHSITEKKEKECFNEIMNHILFISTKVESVYVSSEKFKYSFPKLSNHKKYESIIEADKQRRMFEEKKKHELKKIEIERNMITLEDVNILPHDEIDEENKDDISEVSND